MASNQISTDSTTDLDEAIFNKYCAADGTLGLGGSNGHACWGLKIRYSGGAWEAQAGFGAESQIANVGLTWDGANDWLTVDLSGCDNQFENYPLAVCTQSAAAAVVYNINAYATTANLIRVTFFAYDDAGIANRIGTEATSMDFNCLFFGQIG